MAEVEARFGRKSNVAMTAAGCFTAIGVATQVAYVQLAAILCAAIVAIWAVDSQRQIDLGKDGK